MDKKKLYDEIEKKTGVISTPTEVHEYHTLIANGFILELWKEWKQQCKEQFNDIHWVKIWNDHLKAQAYDLIATGHAKFAIEQMQQPEEDKEKKEEVIPMIGDGEM